MRSALWLLLAGAALQAAARQASDDITALTPCTACLAQGGQFARRGDIEACFYTKSPEFPDITWTRVDNCFAMADVCPPLPVRLQLSPVALCYDIATDPVGARALLVVFWGYSFVSVGSMQPITFEEGDCHNSFSPADAAAPPRIFTPGVVRQHTFVAITNRNTCQRWRLGDSESIICADTIPAGLAQCTQPQTTPTPEPPVVTPPVTEPEPPVVVGPTEGEDDWGEDVEYTLMRILAAGRRVAGSCYGWKEKECNGDCEWCPQIHKCIKRGQCDFVLDF